MVRTFTDKRGKRYRFDHRCCSFCDRVPHTGEWNRHRNAIRREWAEEAAGVWDDWYAYFSPSQGPETIEG